MADGQNFFLINLLKKIEFQMTGCSEVEKKKKQTMIFKPDWIFNRPWLKYNESKDCCFCTLCMSEFAVGTFTATYMLSLLNIPISNASVERIFRMTGALKYKTRNRMLISTVESIIIIKTSFILSDLCCTTFEISDRIIANFNG